MDGWDGEARATVASLIAAYALWLGTAALSFAVGVTWYNALIQLYVTMRWNKYGLAAYTYILLIALIIAWLVLVITTEGWYRRAAEQGLLARRAARMLGVLAVVGVVGAGVGWVV